jgi:hypothetical protein
MSADQPLKTKSGLVGRAEEILDKVKHDRSFKGQTAQLRNLLQIVQTESEVPVLRNFIRYQTGRRATRNFWQLIHQDVITAIEEIDTTYPEEPARRGALQSFFGYLVRHYVYLSEAAGGGGGARSGPGGAGRDRPAAGGSARDRSAAGASGSSRPAAAGAGSPRPAADGRT